MSGFPAAGQPEGNPFSGFVFDGVELLGLDVEEESSSPRARLVCVHLVSFALPG